MTVDRSTSGGIGSTRHSEEDKWDDDIEDDDCRTVPFGKLFSYADSRDWVLMIVGTIGAILNGLCMPLMTVIFGELVDAFGFNQNNHRILQSISQVSLQFVYLAIGSAFVAFLQVTCWMVTGERQASRIRALYLKTILRQDVTFFDREASAGEVVARMSGHIVLIQDAMGEKVGKLLQLLTTFLAGFFIAFVKGWLLTLVMLASIPPLVIAGGIMAVLVSKIVVRGNNAYAKAAIVVEQAIASIRTVASFTREEQAIGNYNKFLIDAYKSGVQEGLAIGMGLGMVMLIVFCSYALAVWFGSKMILAQGYTGGQVLTVIMAFLTGSMSVGQTPPCMSTFFAGQIAAFKMFETISRRPVIDAYDTRGQTLYEIRGDIELRDVYFSYPSRPGEQILKGFSISIPSGTTAALVGQSGSGKSTVISLVERFYDPHSGEVLIDDINLRDFQLKWIRQRIGLVSQDPILFTCSIKDNISYGKEGATDEEIRFAAELANAMTFIDKLPQGLDTMVGKNGALLSGGQKQRVAIARTILKNPRILLVDEATSALDVESERVVQETLDRIMVCRTTVIVAHRLSTVRNADVIAVIQNGKMVEKGSHSELIKDPEGAYLKLIRLQEVSEEPEQDQSNESKLDMEYYEKQESNKKKILLRTLSRGSLGNTSGRHSFSAAFGVPTTLNADVVLEEAETLPALPSEPTRDVSITRLAALNKSEIPVILVGGVAAVANGVILPLFGVLISNVIETFFKPPRQLRRDSNFWAGMFIILGLSSLLAFPVRTYFFSVAGSKLIQRIRSMCFEKIMYMEVGWFDDPEHSNATIGARLSADASVVRALVGDALAQLVQNMASVIAGLVIAFATSWKLALIVLTLIPFIVINGYIQGKFVKGFVVDEKIMYEEANQVASDAIRSIRTIASFCAEEKAMELYEKKCKYPIKAGKRQGWINGIGFGAASLLLFCFYAISFYAGATLVEEGEITFSDVFRVFFALTMAAIGISQSSSMAPDSAKAKMVATSIFGMIDRKSKIDARDESGMSLENIKGDIDLRNISLTYANRPDIHILRDLSLAIGAGQIVALVGDSGSGKSTVIALLQRFYDPDLGQITLDGIDTKKLKLRWFRQQMGLVSQDPTLFHDTIRANIAYGKSQGDATEGEILAASELANANKFISSLAEGYDTVMGESDIQLSEGQKQRIAIARAMVKSPKILLLDEVTSALDVEAERVVQDALDRVMVDRTTLVVAHRLRAVKNADVIAVIKNGVIVENGRHEDLMMVKDGVYASMVALQTSSSNAASTSQ